jgi:hypothetical protein
MHPKGLVEIELSTGKRTLRFGTLAFNIFCKLEGIKLKELDERIKNPEAFTQVNFIYSAALAQCRLQKIEPDFSENEVACWLDEVGEDKIAEMVEQSFHGYESKNVQTPATPG